MGPRRSESAHALPEGRKGPLGVVRALPFEGDDIALTAGMRAGRADVIAAFYKRYVKSVHALTFRLVGPDGELDDMVHDVFVRALESISRLRDPSALRPWLMAIAVRVVRIRFQKRRRQRWLRFMAPEEVPEVATTLDTEAGDALREVYTLLAEIDPEERIALVLHRVQGLPLDEAAAVAEMSLSTFRRRLARAESKFFGRAKNRPALQTWIEQESEP